MDDLKAGFRVTILWVRAIRQILLKNRRCDGEECFLPYECAEVRSVRYSSVLFGVYVDLVLQSHHGGYLILD